MWVMLSRRDFLYLTGALPLLRGQDTQFSTSVAVVNVLVTVRDKNGKIIHDLVQDDFTLQEDGRSQSIRYFAQQSDVPLTLGLLIDTSGSQTRVLDRERNASVEFVDHVLREDKDKTFVIHFDHQVELLQDLTSSHKELEAALKEVDGEHPQLNRRSPGGGGRQGRGRAVVVLEAARRCTTRCIWLEMKFSRSSKAAKRSFCSPTASIGAARLP